MWIAVVNTLSGVTLLPWLSIAFASIFLFDAPNPSIFAYPIVGGILVYPGIVAASVVFSRRLTGRRGLLIASIPVVISVVVGFALYVVFALDAQKAKQVHNAAYMQATQDFVCAGGSFVQKRVSEYFTDFNLFTDPAHSAMMLARITKDGDVLSFVDLSRNAKETLDMLSACTNADGATLQQTYPLVWQEMQTSVKN